MSPPCPLSSPSMCLKVVLFSVFSSSYFTSKNPATYYYALALGMTSTTSALKISHFGSLGSFGSMFLKNCRTLTECKVSVKVTFFSKAAPLILPRILNGPVWSRCDEAVWLHFTSHGDRNEWRTPVGYVPHWQEIRPASAGNSFVAL